jgi:hypothetical protein
MSASAIVPIFPVPAHVECPTGPLRAWFTEPKGAVVQLSEAAAFTEAMARWLIGPGRNALLERFASINPVYLTTLQAAAALLGAFGAQVEVTPDLERVLGRIQLAPG